MTRAPEQTPKRPCDTIVVLIIDDDPSFRKGLAQNLADDGHCVHERALPTEVTSEQLAAADVVVTDFQMGDGITFAEHVRRLRPKIQTLLATAYWTVDMEAAAALRPYIHLCRKPTDYDTLHARIHELASGA